MTTLQLYLSCHPLYLTSQALYLCHHTCCIEDITTSMEIIILGIRKTSWTLKMTSHSHFMTSILIIYDITTTAFMTWDLQYMMSRPRSMTSHPYTVTSQPLYLKHHTHYVCEFISTIFNMKHILFRQDNQYICHHTLDICLCVITHTLHVYNMYDIIRTTDDIPSTLYDITKHYDITPTVFMSSHPVYLTLHPL